MKSIVERELIPAWLRLCKETVALMYALDVGNSDGKVAADVLNVLFKNVPYKELVQNFRSIASNLCFMKPDIHLDALCVDGHSSIMRTSRFT